VIVNLPAVASIPKKEPNGVSEAAEEGNEKQKEKKEKAKKKEKKEKKVNKEKTETNEERNVEEKSDKKEKKAKKEKKCKDEEAVNVAPSTEPQTNGGSRLEPKVFKSASAVDKQEKKRKRSAENGVEKNAIDASETPSTKKVCT
jgi:hypothetical protein